MMQFTDITGLAGVAFSVTAILSRLPVITRLQAKQKMVFVAVLLMAALLPFGGVSLAEFVRGVSGDLSISSILLLIGLYQTMPVGASPAREQSNCREQGSLLRNGINPALLLVAFIALALYPFALGIGMFDPYRLGFGNLWFIAALLLIALLAWGKQYTLVALSISLAVLAWSVGWYESNNLWDCLLDPWVSIYVLGALIKRGVSLATK